MTLASACLILLILWTLGAYQLPLPLSDPFFAWLRRQWLLEGIAALTGIGLLGLAGSTARRQHVSTIPWWTAWCAWMVWASCSLFYSIDQGLSLRSWLAFASYGLLAYLTSRLVTTTADALMWMRFFVGVAMAVGLDGLFQYGGTFRTTLSLLEQLQRAGELTLHGWGDVVIKDFLIRKRIFSLFGWPNLYAGFLLLTIPMAISLSVQARTFAGRIVLAIASGMLSLSLLLTLSLGGWMAAVLTASATWWLLQRPHGEGGHRDPRRSPVLWRALLIGGVLSGVIFLTSFLVAQRARPLILASTTSRFVYVQGAWRVLKAHPLRGTGLGTFGVAYQALKPQESSEGQHNALHAHNTLAEIGAELGIVGLCLFGWWLWQVGRLVRGSVRAGLTHDLMVLQRGLAIGLLGFFLHSLLEQTFVEAVTAPFWWMVLGLLTGLSSLGCAGRSVTSSKNDHMRYTVLPIAVGCLGLVLTLRLAVADLWASQGVFLDRSGKSPEATRAFDQAQQWNPFESRYAIEAGERLLKRLPGLPLAKATPLLVQAQEQFERSVSRSPWLGYAWLRRGFVSGQLGHMDQAIMATREAIRRDPNSRAALIQLIQLLYPTGQWRQLQQAAQQLQQLEPTEMMGWFIEALAWQGLQQPIQAQRVYRSVVQRFPDHYPAWFNLAELLRQEADDDSAAMAYQAFLDTAPNDQEAQRAVAQAFLKKRKKYP